MIPFLHGRNAHDSSSGHLSGRVTSGVAYEMSFCIAFQLQHQYVEDAH